VYSQLEVNGIFFGPPLQYYYNMCKNSETSLNICTKCQIFFHWSTWSYSLESYHSQMIYLVI